MSQIKLSKEEITFLEKYIKGGYNALVAPAYEQDIEIALIEKAGQFESDNDLIDERIEFSPDSDLLKWYYHKYVNQTGEE